MTDIRRAALTLHALEEHDRQWILRQVEPRAQRTLNDLLAELVELGIPADSTLIQEALHVPLRETDPTVHQPEWRRELAAADPEALLEVLGDEPSGLVARILGTGPWPWEQDVLARMPLHRRESLFAARAGLTTPQQASGMLDEWLAQRLLHRCAGRAPVVAEAASMSQGNLQ